MAYGQSSGTTDFNPFVSDIFQDALERADLFAPELKHMVSARRSLNLLLASDWSDRGLNLWKIRLLVLPLVQGTLTYNLTRDVVSVLDTYRRQYPMNQAGNATLDFSTVLGSSVVTVGLPASGVVVGTYVQIALQVSVGGLILYGFYLVTSTPTVDSFTFDAGTTLATATVNNGGVVPVLSTTAASTSVNVLLPNHGLAAGQPFVVPVSTNIGGITIFGSYPIVSIVDANNFTIAASAAANTTDTLTENSGQASIATQNQVAPYTDILMTPISRNDYAAQANKTAPGAPTTYWVNKQIIPQVTVWPVTDNTGPYELRSYVMYQINDASGTGGQTLDLPPRLLYACTLDLARDIAMKFSPKKYALLKQEAADSWDRASSTDVENVTTTIMPAFPRV